MMRKVLDGALWGLGFWLVGGGLMLMFSAFNSHRQVERESDARAAQSGSVEDHGRAARNYWLARSGPWRAPSNN